MILIDYYQDMEYYNETLIRIIDERYYCIKPTNRLLNQNTNTEITQFLHTIKL